VLAGPTYDRPVKSKRRRPGLAKTRGQPLLSKRSIELWQSTDYRWRELFEAADVMSEGATREEPDGATYYGSTSVLLTFSSQGGKVPDERAREMERALAVDPHARLRAVRIACLEAQVRAGAPIGRVRAELFVRSDVRGVRVDIDVEARVFADAPGERPGPRKVQRLVPKPKRLVR
jgi:hypothetical protein